MKNKSKYFYKNINNINLNEHGMNALSDSNNILPSSKRSNYTTNIKKGKNSNEIFSSNGLSFLIYSSNKDTNKHKKDALFGNLLSLSKEKAKMQFNSYLRDSIQKTNSIKNLNKYLENSLNDNNYLTAEKNKLKLNESQLRQLSSIRNKHYDNIIKRDYENFFDNNGIDFSLNDYLNSYKNDENFDNNFTNNIFPDNNNNNTLNNNNIQDKTSPETSLNRINKSCLFNTNETIKENTLPVITEEKHKESKYNAILNETLFNTRIKEKICKIKEDIITNNNLEQKNKESSCNKSKKYINHKLRVDQNIDYYDFLLNELNQLDEAKLLEKVFSEFFSEIKFRFWKKDSMLNFKNSLNNCQLFDLLKLNSDKDSNYFEKYISNIDFTTNKNLSNSIYNSKSERLREGSHSFNDSQSSQTIENQQEKNFPLISKFPKLVIPQSIIPEESSNFLYSNNDNVLNRSVGEPLEENNMNELGDIVECEEDNIYEENIKKELDNIGTQCEINISHIFINMKMNNIFGEDTNFNSYDMIKEYKAKIFYDILLIAQESDVDISQKNNFGKIIKGII